MVFGHKWSIAQNVPLNGDEGRNKERERGGAGEREGENNDLWSCVGQCSWLGASDVKGFPLNTGTLENRNLVRAIESHIHTYVIVLPPLPHPPYISTYYVHKKHAKSLNVWQVCCTVCANSAFRLITHLEKQNLRTSTPPFLPSPPTLVLVNYNVDLVNYNVDFRHTHSLSNLSRRWGGRTRAVARRRREERERPSEAW